MGYQGRAHGQTYVPQSLALTSPTIWLLTLTQQPAERDAAAHLLSFFPDLPAEFTIDAYLDERRGQQDALWGTVRPLPGVVKLVQHLYKHKVPIAVATGSQRRNYEQKSAHLMDELFGCFEGKVVCADDGLIAKGRGKPCPDVFLVTAKKCFGRDVGDKEDGDALVTPDQIAERKKGLVFEDALPGMQAGKRAGMNGACLASVRCMCILRWTYAVVWVPDANLVALTGDASMPSTIEQPDQTLKSLEDFNPEEWGLPPYDS